mmetsp:Transcript_8667/g.15605  ORF Transcript_8667/g.15605 Transcript_8667/m.15605 type:complete len:613 (-) Transcript_8667:180-2018(-)
MASASGPFGLHGGQRGRNERPSSPAGSEEEEGFLHWFGLTYVTELIMGGKMCGGWRDKAPVADAEEAAKYGRPPEPAGRSAKFPAAKGNDSDEDEDYRDSRRGRRLEEDDTTPTTAERSMYGRRGNPAASVGLLNGLEDHLSKKDDGGTAPTRGRQPPQFERANIEDSMMNTTMPGRWGGGPQPMDTGGSNSSRLDGMGTDGLRTFTDNRSGRTAGRDPFASSSRAQDMALGSDGSVNSTMEEYHRMRNKTAAAAAVGATAGAASFGGDAGAGGPRGANPSPSASSKYSSGFNSIPAFPGPPPQSADDIDANLEATKRMPPPPSRPEPREETQPQRPSSKAQWEWPGWAMDSSSACIEVYVEDEETGSSRWVAATPQTRVVNKQGHDAFLTVQYEWDGEVYDQDFEPHHVRRRGFTKTVKEMIDAGTVNEVPPPPKPRTQQPGAGVDLDNTTIDRSMLDRTVVSKGSNDPPPPSTGGIDAKGKLAEMRGKLDHLLGRADDSEGKTAAPDSQKAPAPTGGGKTSEHWKWPAWCLNSKSPALEVFVEDEDTGEGRWVEATPINRVVDKDGNDAFISAEYDWDGEDYVQDFAPEHVRKRGTKVSVQDMIKSGNLA